MKLAIADEKEILSGKSTDKYFLSTMEVLEKKNADPYVVMEASVKSFPDTRYKFGVLSGIEDIACLLEGKPVNAYSMEDGDVFFLNEPVLQIRGRYRNFGVYENSVLGFISKPSGIATKASRVRIAAKDKTLLSFGTRRIPPQDVVMVERAALTGGFDSISNVLAAERLGVKAVGTMPHILMLSYSNDFGDCETAFKAFDDTLGEEVPRVALVDTYGTPKEETFKALNYIGKRLQGVRIDSGDLKKIGKELRWELDIRNRNDVKLFASGGLDEYKVKDLSDIYDGFGVGTKIADAPTIDFALKGVEINGVPKAKTGNYSGAKSVYRKDFFDVIRLKEHSALEGYEPMLKPLIINGKIVRNFEKIEKTKRRFLENLNSMPQSLKEIEGAYEERVKYVG
jgi:nicotinate phosphoribosyltransferase